jgi:hypothetical protein
MASAAKADGDWAVAALFRFAPPPPEGEGYQSFEN